MNNAVIKVKSKAKQYAPEIIVGVATCAAIVGGLYLFKRSTSSWKITLHNIVDPESILVLEQLTVDTYKDLDFGTVFRVTPID